MLLALSQHSRCFQLCCAPIALVCLLVEKKEMSADPSTCAKMQADVSTCEYRCATDDHKKAKKAVERSTSFNAQKQARASTWSWTLDNDNDTLRKGSPTTVIYLAQRT